MLQSFQIYTKINLIRGIKMNKNFILKSGYHKNHFINGKGEPFKKYYFELIDKQGIKITETIKIQNYLTNEEIQNKIDKHLNKLIKSYQEIKKQNLHLYK